MKPTRFTAFWLMSRALHLEGCHQTNAYAYAGLCELSCTNSNGYLAGSVIDDLSN